MDFGTAIDAMKDERKVARKGWNGKGMFLYYVHIIPAYRHCMYTLRRYHHRLLS